MKVTVITCRNALVLLWGDVESACLHRPKNWLMRQPIDLWDNLAHKVGFIREKGKAAPRDGQGAQKIGSSCCLHRGVFIWPFFLGRRVRSRVEWSLNISLQEHMHSPVKSSCLSTLWHFEASPGAMTCEAACPFTGHSALMGDRALAHFVFWAPRPNSTSIPSVSKGQLSPFFSFIFEQVVTLFGYIPDKIVALCLGAKFRKIIKII
jgi:hypothetical protein